MITVRRARERHRVQGGEYDVWLTFPRADRVVDDFYALTAFDEIQIAPGGVFVPDPPDEAEVVTYVYRGALAQESSTGSSGVVHAGEFQRMAVGRGIRHKETNPSRTTSARVFRIALRPAQAGVDFAHEQRRFAAAERHNVACVIASADGRKMSLRIRQDVLVYSSVLDAGHHLIHGLEPGRTVWLHVIDGEATLRDVLLARGDSVGLAVERSVSFTAQERTEILFVDLGPAA